MNAQVTGANQARTLIDAGAKGAMDSTTATTNDANNVLDAGNQRQQNTLNPYLQLGQLGAENLTKALAPGGDLTKQFEFDPTKIADNPDYQFQLKQGSDAVQRAAAANGTLMSGGTLKALDQFSQGLASNEIGQAYNQALNSFSVNRQNAYQSLALPLSVGQTAVPLSQQADQNFTNNSAGNMIRAQDFNARTQLDQAAKDANLEVQKANSRAGGSIAQGNIWSNFSNTVSGSPGGQAAISKGIAALG